MKEKNKKKPRRQTIGFEGNGIEFVEASYGFSTDSNGNIRPFIRNNDGVHYFEPHTNMISYEGVIKEHPILKQPISAYDAPFHANSEILKYPLIIVIDTSYKQVGNKKLASTCWLICERDKSIPSEYNYLITTYLYDWDIDFEGNPELIMYANIIDSVERSRLAKNLMIDIAVIVDSEFDKIDGFNTRSIPIYSDFFLPRSFRIFYANSEKGTTEHFENHLMHLCDKEASESLWEYIQEKS